VLNFGILIGALIGIFIGIYFGLSTNEPSHPVKRWDMPVAYSNGNYHTQMGKKFAREIGLCTNNTVEIIVHGSGSLFKGHEIKRAIQTGQVPIGERLLSSHFNEKPLFAFDSMPFITKNFEEVDLLWQVARPVIEKELDDEGMVLLYSAPWPPQGIYFSHTVDTMDELQGIRLRTYSSLIGRIAELSGMVPVQIESAELNQALAIGVVNAMMASLSTGYDRKVWEHLDYYYDLQAWMPRNYVFANKEKFNGLTDDEQQCFHQVAENIEKQVTLKTIELTQWYRGEVEKNGIKILNAPPELAEGMQVIGRQIVDEWLEETGDTGRKIINDFYAARDKQSMIGGSDAR